MEINIYKGWRRYHEHLVGVKHTYTKQVYKFIDPAGKVHSTHSMRSLARKHNLPVSFFSMLHIDQNAVKAGWRYYKKEHVGISHNFNKHSIVNTNTNMIIQGKTKKEIIIRATNYIKSKNRIIMLLQGKIKEANGWTYKPLKSAE
jgi:hypothetical protein